MKARILDAQTLVYSEPDLNSQAITQVYAGQEVELGNVKKKGEMKWVKVKLATTGQEGYLRGDSRVFIIKLVSLLQNNAKVYNAPSMSSFPKAELKKNDKFYMLEVVKEEDKSWVKIRDLKGSEGFIEGNTKIKKLPVINKNTGKRNMLYGTLWFVGGLVVTVGTLSAASGGGTYIIAWGALLFGGIQFVQGLIQYLGSKD